MFPVLRGDETLADFENRSAMGAAALDLSHVSYCDASAQDLIRKIQAERARRGGRLEITPFA